MSSLIVPESPFPRVIPHLPLILLVRAHDPRSRKHNRTSLLKLLITNGFLIVSHVRFQPESFQNRVSDSKSNVHFKFIVPLEEAVEADELGEEGIVV